MLAFNLGDFVVGQLSMNSSGSSENGRSPVALCSTVNPISEHRPMLLDFVSVFILGHLCKQRDEAEWHQCSLAKTDSS